MPRNMSFAMTTDQARNKTKTVTRRFGWWFLKEGDVIQQVEKAMGLKKGESIKKIHKIRVVDVGAERLCDISQEDVIKEGFPDWTPEDFVNFLKDHYKIKDVRSAVNRIEFEYIDNFSEAA